MIETRKSKLDPRIANSLGQLGMVFLKRLELGELERRVRELESNRRGGGQYESQKQN